MRDFVRRHASLLLRGSCCAAVVVILFGARESRAVRTDTDARIRFYSAKIGGPATYAAYARLGAAYLQKARETGRPEYYSEAERHLAKSMLLQRNFEAACWLAAVYAARHKFQQALPYAREAVSAIPSDLEARGALFDAHLGLGDRKAAAAILAEMLRDGSSFAANTRLAAMRQAGGDLGQAIQAMERACETVEANHMPAETRAWCLVEAGFLHFQNGERKIAEKAYDRSLEILPGYHHALKHLADLRRTEGQLEEAAGLDRRLARGLANDRSRW